MWTPRRILLSLAGAAGFTAAYLAYALVLGGVDGLPDLPAELAIIDTSGGPIDFPDDPVSPTILRLQEAFGPGSPEVTDSVAYKTKLEDRQRGLVFACGQPAFSQEPSKFVPIAPFSLAVFGKPRPAHVRQPGEATEISTFHADKAVLEFDRPVTSPQDAINGKAKLVGIELTSTPDVPSPDPRKGKIWVTNNQRSADPSQFLVFRTPGPLFYRNPETAPEPKPAADAPQVWTNAAVEVIDRKNLPRPLRGEAPPAVPSNPDDLRGRNAVANILLGVTLPPPTVTAEGMKIYLSNEDAKSGKKGGGTGYDGVRLIELPEKVQLNLWTDGGAGFPGEQPGAPRAAAAADPPLAAGGVLGGLSDGAAVARRMGEKTLLVIETLGPFRYDFASNVARFEAAPVANPAVSNHVTASRLTAKGGPDNLSCKLLVVEFADKPDPSKPRPAGGAQADAMKVKALTATGDHVFIHVEADQLSAQGTELKYTADPSGKSSLTKLHGAPVVAVRERNRMQGGDVSTPADVFITSAESPPGGRPGRQTTVEVRGPGRVEMFDAAANDNTLHASWGRSLVQERQLVGGREQDLLKFEGGGAFADTRGGMRLSADKLWLWLGADPSAPAKTGGTPAASPQRLLAVGQVDGASADLYIRKTDQLTVWFREAPPVPPNPSGESLPNPKPIASAARPITQVVALQPAGPDLPPAADAPKKPAAEKPKNPLYLSARVIESWVVRAAPTTRTARTGDDPPPAKYELERARCEDRVMVHQDPEDRAKSARGIDIFGSRLNLDQSRAGSVLTVHGTGQGWAQVYFEDLSLFGPVVVIDQPNNAVSVDGTGRLIMPSSTDLGGGRVDRPADLDIKWSTQMRFFGAKAMAEFVGQVQAVQQPRAEEPKGPPESAPLPRVRQAAFLAPGADPAKPPGKDDAWVRSAVLCHRLDVSFDRPIYFNQFRRNGLPGTGEVAQADPEPRSKEKPKLRSALCTPMPDDEVAKVRPPEVPIRNVVFFEEGFGPGGKTVRGQRVTARQLDVKSDDREQLMYATGPGEVRILQLGNKDGTRTADPAGPKPSEEMKLTLVRFPSRMVARDTGKVFQEATFDDGARVVQVPSDDLNATVVDHALPPRGVFLECSQVLKVSTNKAKKDGPAEQWMTAVGNAQFRNDDYEGVSARITFDGSNTVLEGGGRDGLARLYRRQNAVNNQDYQSARKIIYNNRTGSVTVNESVGAAITSGP